MSALQNGMYVNYGYLNSLNLNMYVLIGPREIGKTYGFKLEMCLRRFIKKGYKFVFFRRFASQKKIEKDWWGSVADSYERQYGYRPVLTQKGMDLFVDGKHAGKILAMSEAIKIKSQEWVNYRTIGVDEIIENYNYQYIDSRGLDEPNNYFWKVVGSIFRYVPMELAEAAEKFASDTNAKIKNDDGSINIETLPKELKTGFEKYFATQKIFMMANAERLVNPYFINFGIVDVVSKDNPIYINKETGMYVELFEKSDMKMALDTLSPIRRMMKSTEYARIYDTVEFEDGDNVNINSRMNLNSLSYRFGFITRGVTYYVYRSKSGNYHISKTGSEDFGKIYSMDMSAFSNKKVSQIAASKIDTITDIVNKNKTSYDSIETREFIYQGFGYKVVRD